MKIKLGIVDVFENTPPIKKLKYFLTAGNLNRWSYSPENCSKEIISVF
jgi:hypothetical protein